MSEQKPFRLVIAGGGTGGHVIPALAIAREMKEKHSAEVLFIGTSRGIETRLVPQAGFKLELVEIGALNQTSLWRAVETLLQLPVAVYSAAKVLHKFRADVVLGVGGYASGPAMIAAILQGCPTMVFEPNLQPGFANRMVAGFVRAAAVHFEGTKKHFKNARVTGVPVRKEFFALPVIGAAQGKTLLVTGGSQGAHAINETMCKAIRELEAEVKGLMVVHQTGQKDCDEVRRVYAEAGVQAEVSAFLDDMPSAFARADVVLCRSGASTCAELAASGCVSVFVPFPFATDDHQTRNAQAFVERGAAEMILQKELTEEKLVSTLAPLLNDDTRRAKMSDAARGLAHPNATAEIAQMILELGKR